MSLITTTRLRNIVLLLTTVSTFSSCVRHETICECWNWHVNNGAARKHYLLAKRIKKEDAEKQCADIFNRNRYRMDTCRVTIIK